MKWAYIFLVTYYLSFAFCSEDCHNGLSEVKRFLGSKTPYRYVAYDNTDTFHFDGCQSEKMIGFIRHGTRTPGEKGVKLMKQSLPMLKRSIHKAAQSRESDSGFLCMEAVEKLYSWEPKVENGNKWLTHEGEDEMIDLAERLLKRFPQHLPPIYSNETYFFKNTKTQRTQESARYFAIGLFGRYHINSIDFPEGLEKDPILRFYKGCERWKKTIKDNIRALTIPHNFRMSDVMLNTCKMISNRLGLNYTLTYEDVRIMYVTCAFETAWHKTKLSPWCSVFTESDFEVMQYASDLKHYWVDGYGYNLTYKVACPAIKHIFSFLEHDNQSNASAVFYFTHSGTLLKLISHLGLYKDDQKLSDLFSKEEREGRKWNLSYVDAFGTNLIFVSYNCDGEKKVLTLHQERPVQIPGCPDNGLCPLSTILNNFEDSINNCHVNEMCQL